MGQKAEHAPHDAPGTALSALCAVLLAITLFAAGFAACCLPETTRAFSERSSDFATSPYGHDQLVDLAVATRDYTVDGTSRESLYTQIVDAARASAFDGSLGKISRWNSTDIRTGLYDETADPAQVAQTLAAHEQYCLDETELSHLDDCYKLISGVKPWLVACAIITLMLLGMLIVKGHKRQAARALIIAPALLTAFMVVCGIWAAVDFDGLFEAFHGVLFPQGNWTFSYDSLLICMYPLDFWVSMGAVWLAVTIGTCIIAMICGVRLRNRARMEASISSKD